MVTQTLTRVFLAEKVGGSSDESSFWNVKQAENVGWA